MTDSERDYLSDEETEVDDGADGADVDIDADTDVDLDELDTTWDEQHAITKPAQLEYSRDIIVVKPEDRQTSHIMSQYEFSNIIEIRTSQISEYANCLVDTKGLPTAELQARKELLMRKTPLVIRRPIGEKIVDGKLVKYMEVWHPYEMTVPMQYFMRY